MPTLWVCDQNLTIKHIWSRQRAHLLNMYDYADFRKNIGVTRLLKHRKGLKPQFIFVYRTVAYELINSGWPHKLNTWNTTNINHHQHTCTWFHWYKSGNKLPESYIISFWRHWVYVYTHSVTAQHHTSTQTVLLKYDLPTHLSSTS